MCFVRARVRSCAAGGDLVVRARTARGEKAGIARGVRMRRFKHIWERRENRRSSASAAHLERLGLREHEPFLLGERGDRLLFLGRGRLLLLGGHRAAEGGPRAPEWGGRRIARAETSATQNELTRFARDAELVRMREQSRDSGERAVPRKLPIRACPLPFGGAPGARRSGTREPPRTASPSRRSFRRP